jgi:hypothetical protein
MPNRAEILKRQFRQSLGSPWEKILPDSRLEELLAAEKVAYRNCVYSPIVTLWAMVSQALDPDKSLRNAVKEISTYLTVAGAQPPSSDTGAYSKARHKLPEGFLKQTVIETAEQLEQTVPEAQQWCKRRVRVCDGTTALMSDSEENQAAYPQHGNQAPGCGFPIAKLVVFFSLLTGAVVMACIAPWTTSEIVMSRLLYETLEPGDVLVADQAYGSYVDLALIQQQQADGVLRKHHARQVDFRRGQKFGLGDHQVLWHKPKQRPDHMTQEQFASIPETMLVREVCLRINRIGWRGQQIIIVTTLLDAKRYSVRQLTELYGYRWTAAEVNLRHVKTTLKMEMLTAKTPEMVRKDIWAHFLAYNLLRSIMEQSAQKADYLRSRLSLQGTRQLLNQIRKLLATSTKAARQRLYRLLLKDIATDLLPVRPYRQEPRVVKRRPKPFPRMTQPRDLLRARLLA